MDDERVHHGYCKSSVEEGAGVEGEVGVGERGEAGALHHVPGTAENVTVEQYSQVDKPWGGVRGGGGVRVGRVRVSECKRGLF